MIISIEFIPYTTRRYFDNLILIYKKTISSFSSLVTIVLTSMDKRQIFTSNGSGLTLFLIFLLYGIGTILSDYVFSFLAKTTPTSIAFFVIVALLAGVVAPNAVYYMKLVGDHRDRLNQREEEGEEERNVNLPLISDVVRYIFNFIPTMPAVRGLMALVQVWNHLIILQGLKDKNSTNFMIYNAKKI